MREPNKIFVSLDELPKLEAVIKSSWSRDTSADSERWSPSRPDWGQCVVSSLLINELLDPSIAREIVTNKAKLAGAGPEVNHYAVKLTEENVLVDVTYEQFPEGTRFTQYKPIESGRDNIVDHLDDKLAQKYLLLKNRVLQKLRNSY